MLGYPGQSWHLEFVHERGVSAGGFPVMNTCWSCTFRIPNSGELPVRTCVRPDFVRSHHTFVLGSGRLNVRGSGRLPRRSQERGVSGVISPSPYGSSRTQRNVHAAVVPTVGESASCSVQCSTIAPSEIEKRWQEFDYRAALACQGESGSAVVTDAGELAGIVSRGSPVSQHVPCSPEVYISTVTNKTKSGLEFVLFQELN